MADESGDKVQDRQRHNFSNVGIMVEVLIGDGFAIVVFDTGFTDRGPFEVLAQVVNIGFHIV
ncbi:MAG: hypothetical protein A3K50_03830 [Planctomycetes bacterium RIFOXYD12_FULL_42_12]|nr:MAG: hypothetical protein A3J92_04930 [Planctomycetes bacterium RIFOXYC2_FULL_41_27]OHC11672.1 MAG: hypothetical protein A3K50_03830 [Planctomycetes bacterium RIFOXYD12_FULL_42_12]